MSFVDLLRELVVQAAPERRSSWRTLLPPAGSTLPQSKIFSDRLRRTAFDSIRSLIAAARCSSSVTSDELVLGLAEVDRHALEVEALLASRRTWSRALRSSCSSKSLTTSKETSPAMSLPAVRSVGDARTGGDASG